MPFTTLVGPTRRLWPATGIQNHSGWGLYGFVILETVIGIVLTSLPITGFTVLLRCDQHACPNFAKPS